MLELIEKLLKRVIESGAKIKVAKSEVMQTAVKYLGFLILDEGIKMDSRYRQALVDFPEPNCPTALARFLGMVGYYKTFLPNLLELAARLHSLKMRQDWTKMPAIESEDFRRIKESILDSEALSSPDFLDLKMFPFIMGLDFSKLAIAVTISQIQRCKDGEL